jgi:hypothetical protein
MKRLYRIIYPLFVLALIAANSSTVTSSLSEYKKTYETRVGQIKTEYEATVARATAAYAKLLDYALNAGRTRGDLDTVVAAQKEKKRFETEKSVPDASPAEMPEWLKRQQDSSRARISSARIDKDKKHVQLLTLYLDALEALKKRLTTEGKIDEALAVKDVISIASLEWVELRKQIPEEEPALSRERSGSGMTARNPWTVVFRSDNPMLWDTDHREDDEGFAIKLEDVPDNIKFLRLRRMDTEEFIIIEITKDELPIEGRNEVLGWNGSNKHFFGGRHLGVYSKRLPKTVETKFARGGWGFGHPYGDNDRQMYAWEATPIARTAFEISVKQKPLTSDEKKTISSRSVRNSHNLTPPHYPSPGSSGVSPFFFAWPC